MKEVLLNPQKKRQKASPFTMYATPYPKNKVLGILTIFFLLNDLESGILLREIDVAALLRNLKRKGGNDGYKLSSQSKSKINTNLKSKHL